MPQIIDHPNIPGAKQVILLPSEPRPTGSVSVAVSLDKKKVKGTVATPTVINVTVITSTSVATVTPTLSPVDAEITIGTVTGSGTSWAFTLTVAKTGTAEVNRTIVVNVATGGGATGTGSELFVVDNAPPNAPTAPAATGVTSGIQVSWTRSTSTDVDYYNVYYNTASTPTNGSVKTFIGSTTGTVFTHTGLASGTQLWYWVTAVDLVGNESVVSTQVTATSLGDIKLSLTLVKQRVGGSDTFEAAVSADQSINSSWLLLSVSPTDTDVTFGAVSPSGAGTNYTFNVIVSKATVGTFTRSVVVQIDTSLSSGKSGVASSAFVIDTQAPAIPTALILTPRIQSARLTWTPPADLDIAYYLIYRNTTNSIPGSNYSKSLDISFLDSAMDANTTYFYWVKTVDTVGNIGAASSSVSGTTLQVITTDIQNLAITLAKMASASVDGTKIVAGAVDLTKFASGLQPVQVVASLGSISSPTQGMTAFQTSDNKLYRYTGSVWVTTVPTTDLTGTVSAAQIANAAITAVKIGFIMGGDNVIFNSSFESDLTGWSVSGGSVTAVTSPVFRGSKALSIVSTTYQYAYETVTLPLGSYVGSVFIKTDSAYSATNTTGIKIENGTGIVGVFNAGTAPVANQDWIRQINTFTVTTAGTFRFLLTNSYGGTASGSVWFDAAQLEWGEVATAWAPKADEILPNTITATEIADNAVTTNKLIANAVTAAKIAAGTITATQIAATTITAAQIAAHTITASQIQSGTITATEIAANTITAGNILANTITAGQIAAGTITATQIATDTIVANNIAANAITSSELAANSVIAAKIAAASVTATKLAVVTAAVDPGKFTNSSPAAGRVSWAAVTIVMDGVTYTPADSSTPDTQNYYIWFKRSAPTVLQLTVRGTTAAFSPAGFTASQDVLLGYTVAGVFNQVWSGTAISGDQILTGTILASHITVNTLSAINTDIGTISAGIIQDNSDSLLTKRGIRLSSSYGIPTNWSGDDGVYIDFASAFGVSNRFMQIGQAVAIDWNSSTTVAATFKGVFNADTISGGTAQISGNIQVGGVLAPSMVLQTTGSASGYGLADKARTTFGGADAFTIYADALQSTASSGTANTTTVFHDDNQLWGIDQFAGASYLTLISGSGAQNGESRLVVNNTSNSLTVSPAFSGIPAATATYKIDNVRNFTVSTYLTTVGGSSTLVTRQDTGWTPTSNIDVTRTTSGTTAPDSANSGPVSGDTVTDGGGVRSSNGDYTVSWLQTLDSSAANVIAGTVTVTGVNHLYYRTSGGGAWVDTGLETSMTDSWTNGSGPTGRTFTRSVTFNVPTNPAYVEFKIVPGLTLGILGKFFTGSAFSRVVGNSAKISWTSSTAGTGTQVIRRNPRLFANSYWTGSARIFSPHLTMEPLATMPNDSEGRTGDVIFAAGAFRFHNGTSWLSIGGSAASSFVVKTGDTMTGDLVVNAPSVTANTPSTYHYQAQISSVAQLTWGADGSNAFIQSWNSKPLWINNQGNRVILGSLLRVGADSGGTNSTGEIVSRKTATTGAFYAGDSSSTYWQFDGTNWLSNGGVNGFTTANSGLPDAMLTSNIPRLNGGINSIFSSVTSSATETGEAIRIREFNLGGAQTGAIAQSPRIGFYWSGRVSMQLGMDSGGGLHWWDSTAASHGGANFGPVTLTTLTTNAAGIADASLSSNIPRLNQANTFTTGQIISGTSSTLSIQSTSGTLGYLTYLIDAANLAFIGVAPSANLLVTGSVTGDLCVRSEAHRILFSTNSGTSVGASLDSGIFRVGGTTGGALSGDIVARRNSTSGAYYFGDSITAYIYHDGTSYYLGAAGNGLYVQGYFRTDNYFYADQMYGGGLVGLYNPAHYRMVYCIGDSWKMLTDGSSLTGFYGAFYAYDDTSGTGKNITGLTLQHGLGISRNGTATAYIGEGMWTRGGIWALNNMTAPDFVLS